MKVQIHASCASRDDAGVLLLGPAGSGKSDLLLRLIDRGFTLVADDRVELETGMATPAPGLEGLVEMRGLGILRLPYRAPVRLVLACELLAWEAAERPPRLPEPAWHRLGVPMVRLDARVSSAPLLVVHALDCAQNRMEMHTGAFA